MTRHTRSASAAARSSAPTSFGELYRTVAVPRLKSALGLDNPHALPRVTKVVVAAGVGKHRTEGKFVEDVVKGLTSLTGQKPAARAARQSIAGLKVRQGQVVGYLVTLRGQRMEDFLARLLWVALPRVRDFRGLPLTSVDRRGNLSIGLREAAAFPEVDPAAVETPFGFQVTIVTTARNREEALALFRGLSVPFAETAEAEKKERAARSPRLS